MAMELTLNTVRGMIPSRAEAAHKGDFGHVFVIAGSRGFTGAARLACEAAGRSGAGLVTLGVPYPLADAMACALLEAMSFRLPSTESETVSVEALEMALSFARDKQCVLIGPGLSREPETAQFVLDFLPQSPAPLVADADALNALSEQPAIVHDLTPGTILTPHPGEMARLTGLSSRAVQEDREGIAARYAEEWNVVVVLKGYRTVVAAPGKTAMNTTGNHGMATGGTGDVLAGLIAGLRAQGMEAFEAAALGVFLHGLAGDIAAERHTARGMIAGDLLSVLGEAWKRVGEDSGSRAGFLAR